MRLKPLFASCADVGVFPQFDGRQQRGSGFRCETKFGIAHAHKRYAQVRLGGKLQALRVS